MIERGLKDGRWRTDVIQKAGRQERYFGGGFVLYGFISFINMKVIFKQFPVKCSGLGGCLESNGHYINA